MRLGYGLLVRVHYPRAARWTSSSPFDGHDDYLVSLSLVVDAAKEMETRLRVARGRLALE